MKKFEANVKKAIQLAERNNLLKELEAVHQEVITKPQLIKEIRTQAEMDEFDFMQKHQGEFGAYYYAEEDFIRRAGRNVGYNCLETLDHEVERIKAILPTP